MRLCEIGKEVICHMAKVEKIIEVPQPPPMPYASFSHDGLTFYLPLTKEQVVVAVPSLQKKLATAQKDLVRLTKSLDNPAFMEKGNPEVVFQAQKDSEFLKAETKRLEENIQGLLHFL